MHSLETSGASRQAASFDAFSCPLLAARFALSALCVGLSAACGAVTCPDGSVEAGGQCQEAEVLDEDIQGHDDVGTSDASVLENEDSDVDAGEDAGEGVGEDADGDAQTGEDAGFEPGLCDAEDACEPGAQVACLTVCGTEGRGACSETCSEPTVDTCTPPSEVCNWVDDDCDGVVDPGLLQAQPGLQAFTAEGAQEFSLSELSFVPRADGGQWLLYSDAPTYATGDGRPIYARQVDADGRAVGALSVLSGSARTLRFRAAGDGKWLAVLAQQRGTIANDTIFIKLLLYKASDLSFVAEYKLAELLDEDGKRNDRDDFDDCHFASIGDVALREDAHRVSRR